MWSLARLNVAEGWANQKREERRIRWYLKPPNHTSCFILPIADHLRTIRTLCLFRDAGRFTALHFRRWRRTVPSSMRKQRSFWSQCPCQHEIGHEHRFFQIANSPNETSMNKRCRPWQSSSPMLQRYVKTTMRSRPSLWTFRSSTGMTIPFTRSSSAASRPTLARRVTPEELHIGTAYSRTNRERVSSLRQRQPIMRSSRSCPLDVRPWW